MFPTILLVFKFLLVAEFLPESQIITIFRKGGLPTTLHALILCVA